MQITAEIMQTYDQNKFSIASSKSSTLLKTPPYYTAWGALHKRKWSDKKGWVSKQRTANAQMSQTMEVM